MKKLGKFKTYEAAKTEAENQDSFVKKKIPPISMASMMKLFKVKKGVTLSSVKSPVTGCVGVRIETSKAKDTAGPIDYFIDSSGVIRGINYLDSAKHKVMDVRIDNFIALDEVDKGLGKPEIADDLPRHTMKDIQLWLT